MLELFISHSSKDALGTQVREAIIGALRELGRYEIFWDQAATRGGDDWRGIIDEALLTCRGAVLVLSEAALSSDWVRKEVNILLWRKALDPKIRIVAVLVPPLVPESPQLAQFRTGELAENQFVTSTPGVQLAGVASDLAAKTRLAFETTQFDEPDPVLSRWLEDVRFYVGQSARLHQERAAAALGMPEGEQALAVPSSQRTRDLPERIAYRLLQVPHRQALRAVRELAEGLSDDRLRNLCSRVRPLWVRAEAASCIPPVMRAPEEQRILALNSADFRSPQAFVARALCGEQPFHVISARKELLSATANADLFDQVRGLLERELGLASDMAEFEDDELEGDEPAPRDEPEARLFANLRSAEKPIFVAIAKKTVAAPGALASLRRIPHITLMVMSGAKLPDPAALGLPAMRLVVPELGPHEEQQAWSDITLELDKLIAAERPGTQRT